MSDRPPRIVFFGPDFSDYTSRLLDGVQKYQSENGLRLRDQRASLQALRNTNEPPPWSSESVDGVVSYIGREDGIEQWLSGGGVPVVNCTADLDETVPAVFTDCDALIQLAVEHLAKCETEHFAFITSSDSAVAVHRQELFEKHVRDRGSRPHLYEHRLRFSPSVDVMQAHREDPDLRDFLAEVPKPCAIFCQNDFIAGTVFDLCDALGLSMREQVFLLGMNGQFTRSRGVSSIEQSGGDVGHAAARMVHSLIARLNPQPRILVKPRGVITADTTIPREPYDFDQAVRMIDQYACDGLTVEDLIATQSISRKTFERYFQKKYQCAPGELIRLRRFERSKELLCRTDLSIRRIGQMVGFSRNSAFTIFFKKQSDMSPREFRVNCGEAQT